MGKYKPGQDREMILDPDEWPLGTHLPLKRLSGKYPNIGYLIIDFESSFLEDKLKPSLTVYHGPVGTVQENRPYTDYTTVDELLADGWLVD